MIHVMLQNEAKPVDQSTVELGSVAISGEVDTCSISTGDGWTEGTRKGIRGSNHRRDTVSSLLRYDQGREPNQPRRRVTHVLRTRDSRIDNRLTQGENSEKIEVLPGKCCLSERTRWKLPYPLKRNHKNTVFDAISRDK